MPSSKTLRSAGQSGSEPRPASSGDAEIGTPEPTPQPPDAREHLDLARLVRLLEGQLDEAGQISARAHLERCGGCQSLFERVNRWGDSTRNRGLMGDWENSHSVFPSGLRLAQRYRIRQFVARGGMGEVYDVWDEELGERVALKTVAGPYAGDAEAIAQLKVEVQLARRVSHRNVCRLHDIGTHGADGRSPLVFLTMEFIEGMSLGEFIRSRHGLDQEFARCTAIGILEGLHAAHEAGVLHRDLKSDNVMLRAGHEEYSVPVLMDFGLASALNPNSSRVSSGQALVGSLAYMAPEQVQGDALRVATDLYAFGVIFFEMLTGRLPFTASTPAVAAFKRLQEPAPLITEIDPDLSDDLARIVARCLEREPSDRYASASEILEELAPHWRPSIAPIRNRSQSIAPVTGQSLAHVTGPAHEQDEQDVPTTSEPVLSSGTSVSSPHGRPGRSWTLVAVVLALAGLVGGLLVRTEGDEQQPPRTTTGAAEPRLPEAAGERLERLRPPEPSSSEPPTSAAPIEAEPPATSETAGKSPKVAPMTSGVPSVRRQSATARPSSVDSSPTLHPSNAPAASGASAMPIATAAPSTTAVQRRCPPGILCPASLR